MILVRFQFIKQLCDFISTQCGKFHKITVKSFFLETQFFSIERRHSFQFSLIAPGIEFRDSALRLFRRIPDQPQVVAVAAEQIPSCQSPDCLSAGCVRSLGIKQLGAPALPQGEEFALSGLRAGFSQQRGMPGA